jgi:sec-independent protein translocase protein TatA
MGNLLFLGLSIGETIIIVLAIIMLFGAKSIPDIAKGLGKGLKELKKVTEDLKSEIKVDNEVIDTVRQVKKKIIESGEEFKSDIINHDLLKDAKDIKDNLSR